MQKKLPWNQNSDARRNALPTADTQSLVPNYAPASAVRCASMTGAGRSTRPMAPTTASCPSASSFPVAWRMSSRPSRSVDAMLSPCYRVVAAPVWPGRLQHRRRHRHVQVHAHYHRDRSRAAAGAGAARPHPRRTARRRRALHLTFGPDPSTHAQCTLGGMIGNNSCGTHSVMAGKTVTTSSRSTSSPTMACACASARPARRNWRGSSRRRAAR